MAQDSKRKRHTRHLKRERTLLRRALQHMVRERDEALKIAAREFTRAQRQQGGVTIEKPDDEQAEQDALNGQAAAEQAAEEAARYEADIAKAQEDVARAGLE